jgi:ABC-type sugar transport system permease subunit
LTTSEVATAQRAPAEGGRRRLVGEQSGSPAGRSGLRSFLVALPFITPSLLGVTFFLLIPVVLVFVISFLNWNELAPATWAGFQNYLRIFTVDGAAHSLGVTAYYVLLNIPLQTVLAIGLAVLLHRGGKGIPFFRAVFVAPYLSTPVAMAVIWYWVLDPRLGLVNTILRHVGIQGPQYLSSSLWVMPVVAFVNIWQYVGYNMLFFLAGLDSIPVELYEASALDGAGKLRQFFRISLPLLHPTLLFVITTGVIGSFQIFDTLFVLTQGGPGDSTQVLNYQIYELGFVDFRLGEAAAMSVLLFGVILVFSIGQFWFFRSRTTYEYQI